MQVVTAGNVKAVQRKVSIVKVVICVMFREKASGQIYSETGNVVGMDVCKGV